MEDYLEFLEYKKQSAEQEKANIELQNIAADEQEPEEDLHPIEVFFRKMQATIDAVERGDLEVELIEEDTEERTDEIPVTYDFSDILDIMKVKNPTANVARTSWGKSVYVFLVQPSEKVELDDGDLYSPEPYFTLVSGDRLVSWQPDVDDLLATNWVVV